MAVGTNLKLAKLLFVNLKDDGFAYFTLHYKESTSEIGERGTEIIPNRAAISEVEACK